MRALLFVLGLSLAGCGGDAPVPVRIELARERTKEGGEAAMYCHVDRAAMEGASVQEAAVADFARKHVESVFREMVSIWVETFFDTDGQDPAPPAAPAPPAWVPRVFPDGMDLEIVEVDKSGNEKVTRSRVPIADRSRN